MSHSVPFVLALSLLGCRTSDEIPVASSSTLAASRDGTALYALNVDEGSLARFVVAEMRVDPVPTGSEPTRLTTAGDRVWVTLRGERSVVAFDDGAGGLTEAARAEVGAEPYGIVTTANGARVYVAVSLEDKVVELDGATLELLREWEVADEPRWLSLNGMESALFVASARDGRFTRIDLESGSTSEVELPKTGHGQGPVDVDGGVDFVVRTDADPIVLELTITGDPALSADGETLAVPVVYADTTTPVVSGEVDLDGDGEPDGGDGGGGYASAGVGVSRFNPALVLLPLDREGNIDGEPQAVLLGVSTPRGTLRSVPSAVTSDPDGRYFVVTMEGSNAALLVDTEPFRGQGADEPAREVDSRVDLPPAAFGDPFGGFHPSQLGFWDRPVTAIDTGAGPRGVAFVDDQLFVHSFLDRTVGWVGWEDAREVNRHLARDRKFDPEKDEDAPVLELVDAVELDPAALPSSLHRGQRLFYSAVDRDITARDGGVSCATCHVDGRTDGRTWPFAGATPEEAPTLRQTPSLAGKVSETAPFTWDGTVSTVATEASMTSHDRMGGKGLDEEQLVDLVTFVDAIRTPDIAGRGVESALVLEGLALFERQDVGCTSCHAGARFTDGLNHPVLGAESNTPTLTGIAATAPYLHDGSARTLRDVLSWARSGAMGDTSTLDDAELDALEAYLKSL